MLKSLKYNFMDFMSIASLFYPVLLV